MRLNNKYGNSPTVYGGRVFASKLEARHARDLDLMRHAKDPKDKVVAVNYQYRMPIKVNGVHIAFYVADFYVLFEDGHHEIHESKGMRTAIYLIKKRLVEAIYGERIIEFT